MEIRPGFNAKQKATDDWPLIPSFLLEAAPNGWLIVDMDGQIVMVNHYIEEFFGYTRSQLVGSSLELLLPDAQRDGHFERPQGQTTALLLDATRKDGSEFAVEVRFSSVQTPAGVYVIAVLQDVTDRIRIEEERNAFELELERERERQRIGMDLHDGVMQEIYGAGITLELALADLVDQQTQAAAQNIERSIDQLHNVIRNIRRYIFDLRPREFSGSVYDALIALTSEFSENSLIEAKVDLEPGLPEIDGERALTIYHITHEALSNVHKHAKATAVLINLRSSSRALQLEIKDDGAGFDPAYNIPERHRGMRNMSARVRAIGGFLDVHSVPGTGTALRAEIPLDN